MHKRERLGKRETQIGCPRYFHDDCEKNYFLQINDHTTWGEMYGIDNVLLSTEDEKRVKAAFVEKNEAPQRKMVCKYVHFFKGNG